MHNTKKLNDLTTGQLQRKIRYALSKFKCIDEDKCFQNNFKTIENNRSSRKSILCDGTVDALVTVRQVEHKHHHCQSSDHIWKSYVDRLFDQGRSADEIQRLLYRTTETTMQTNDYHLQDVFNYIYSKDKQCKSKIISSTTTTTHQQSRNLSQLMKSSQIVDKNNRSIPYTLSPISVNDI